MKYLSVSLLALASCATPVATQDLYLLAIGSEDVVLDRAVATPVALLLQDCEGAALVIELNEELDLLNPSPIGVPTGTWCDLAVEFAVDPFDGALALEGTSSAGDFSVNLDPGLVVLELPAVFNGSDAALVLEAGDLLDDFEVALEPQPVTLNPDDALAEAMAEELGAYMYLLDDVQEGPLIYIDLWPFEPVEFSAQAEVNFEVGGCGGGGLPEASDGSTAVVDERDGGVAAGSAGANGGAGLGGKGEGPNGGEADDDPSTGSSGSGCDGSGCPSGGGGGEGGGSTSDGGSSSSCDGGSCGGSADCSGALCSSAGVAPHGAWLLSLILLRRRRRGEDAA